MVGVEKSRASVVSAFDPRSARMRKPTSASRGMSGKIRSTAATMIEGMSACAELYQFDGGIHAENKSTGLSTGAIVRARIRSTSRFARGREGQTVASGDETDACPARLSGEQAMRDRKVAGVDADIEARIAQIEQMTLDQITALQCRMLTEIAKERITPREAGALDRALRKRLKTLEQELRKGG